MGDELILKIVEVNPPSSESGSKNIIKATGEWYTRDKEAKIVIDFGNALISLISIQNYHADQVNIRLKGENSDEIYYDKVIWKNDEWNKLQSVDIEPFSQEIYNQMIVEVLNYTQKDYKGLKELEFMENKTKQYITKGKIRKQQKKEQKQRESFERNLKLRKE